MPVIWFKSRMDYWFESWIKTRNNYRFVFVVARSLFLLSKQHGVICVQLASAGNVGKVQERSFSKGSVVWFQFVQNV